MNFRRLLFLMIKYYLDTSIWLDYYEKRSINSIKAIIKIIGEGGIIIYSDFVLVELKHLGYSSNEIRAILNISKINSLERVHLKRR